MAASRFQVIGFYVEGASIIVVDGIGREHKADSPDELWRALCSIQTDKALPSSTIEPGTRNDETEIVEDEGTYAMLAQHVEAFVAQSHSPLHAKLAAGLIRNGGPRVVNFLRRISRIE